MSFDAIALVERGSVSSIAQIQCRPDEIADANRHDAEQPRIHADCRRVQIGVLGNAASLESFRVARQAVDPGNSACLCATTSAACCVRSVMSMDIIRQGCRQALIQKNEPHREFSKFYI